MKKINPSIILPIVALFIMVIQNTTGAKFDSAELQIINDSILSILALIGILSNPTKKDQEK